MKEPATEDPDSRHRPTKVQFGMALFVVASCTASFSAAAVSYFRMSAAVSEVGEVVDNWAKVPIVDIKLVSVGATCPAGYDAMNGGSGEVLEFPEPDTLGCGCPTGAEYEGISQESDGFTCSTNQTAAGCFDAFRTSAFSMNSYRQSKICIKREGEAVLDRSLISRPEPDPDTYLCPDGYTRCGPSNNDQSGSTCSPDNSDGTNSICPLTFIATSNTFDYYEYPPAVFTTNNEPLESGTQATFVKTTAESGVEPRLHFERSNTHPDTTSKIGKVWDGNGPIDGAMPVVEIMASVMDPNSSPDGVCFAAGLGFGDNDERDKFESAYFINNDPTEPKSYSPESCEHPDKRWFPIDTIGARDFLDENFVLHPYCVVSGSSLSVNDAQDTDYFDNNNIKCSSSSNTAKQCATSPTGYLEPCPGGDSICENTFYQSKCGNVMRFAKGMSSGLKVGLYVSLCLCV